MLNIELLEDRLNQIRVSAKRLERMKVMSLDEFLANPDNFAVAEHHLRRSLEALFDIGRHIAAKEGFGKPDKYRDVIRILGQSGVLQPEFSKRIEGMAGYRNRLVHGYSMVSPREIYEIIKTRLDDFAVYCSSISTFIEQRGEFR